MATADLGLVRDWPRRRRHDWTACRSVRNRDIAPSSFLTGGPARTRDRTALAEGAAGVGNGGAVARPERPGGAQTSAHRFGPGAGARSPGLARPGGCRARCPVRALGTTPPASDGSLYV